MVLVALSEKAHPQKRPAGKIEDALRSLRDPRFHLPVPLRLRYAAEVREGQIESLLDGDALHGPFVHDRERRPKNLVSGNDRGEGAPERVSIERAADPVGAGNVEGCAGLELIQEPETLLGEGERKGDRVRGHTREAPGGRGRGACCGAGRSRILRRWPGYPLF